MFITKTTGSPVATENALVNVITDPYFNYNSLLLHGDGSNGANNDVFVDSSTSAFSLTKTGTPTQGTFSPYAVTGWSNRFNGTTDYLTANFDANYALGTGNFTVECWIYPTAWTNDNGTIIDFRQATGVSDQIKPRLFLTGGTLALFVSQAIRITTTLSSLNMWYHIALVRSSGSTKLYVNGLQAGSTYTDANNYGSVAQDLVIGQVGDSRSFATGYFAGYISDLRLVKGTAVYTGNFSVPTSSLTAITDTVLLTCHSNRFRDGSILSTQFTLSISGTPSVQPFSPLAPIKPYSKLVGGGSVRFNGTTDYLTAPASNSFYFDTGNFQLSAWVYPFSFGTTNTVILDTISGSAGTWTPGMFTWFINTSGSPTFYYASNTSFLGGGAGSNIKLNAWNFIVFERSGSSTTHYLNGSFSGGASGGTIGTDIFGNNIIPLTIGNKTATNPNTSLSFFNGYITDLKISKTTGILSVTVPTVPAVSTYVSSSNTQLLLSATNAGIIDSTQKNNLTTIGSAIVSSAQKKFGSTSIFFNGTTDYLSIPTNDFFAMGTGNFTVEFWAYWNAVSSTVPGNVLHTVTSGTTGLSIYINSTQIQLARYNVAADLAVSSTETTGSWNHYAITRNNNIAYIFKNGVLLGSGAVATNYVQSGLQIGLGTGSAVSGYIDDLRVTKGIARYTVNFILPKRAFPNR